MDVDQGLRYELSALLGACRALEPITRAFPAGRLVRLDAGDIALIPITSAFVEQVDGNTLDDFGGGPATRGRPQTGFRGKEVVTGPESGFIVLTPGLAALIEIASADACIAYIEADYLGRDGRQAAAVWSAGRLDVGPLLLGAREPFDPTTAPVSIALGALGVETRGRRDAFLIAGLHRHRRTKDWGEEPDGLGGSGDDRER